MVEQTLVNTRSEWLRRSWKTLLFSRKPAPQISTITIEAKSQLLSVPSMLALWNHLLPQQLQLLPCHHQHQGLPLRQHLDLVLQFQRQVCRSHLRQQPPIQHCQRHRQPFLIHCFIGINFIFKNICKVFKGCKVSILWSSKRTLLKVSNFAAKTLEIQSAIIITFCFPVRRLMHITPRLHYVTENPYIPTSLSTLSSPATPPPWLPQLTPLPTSRTSSTSSSVSASTGKKSPLSTPTTFVAAPISKSPTNSTTSSTASNTSVSKAKIHKCIHTDCNYATDRRSNLTRHVVAMHEKKIGRSSHFCCGLHFENKAKQRLHAKLEHAQGYKCLVRDCTKRFQRKTLLDRHMATHDPTLRKHECSTCGYRTANKSNLHRHDEKHK